MIDNFKASFYQNFIEDDRWRYIVGGLGNTLKITLFAVVIGIALGFLVAVIRSTYEKTVEFPLQDLLDSHQRNAGIDSAFDYLFCRIWLCEN